MLRPHNSGRTLYNSLLQSFACRVRAAEVSSGSKPGWPDPGGRWVQWCMEAFSSCYSYGSESRNHWAPCYSYGSEGRESLGPVLQLFRGSETLGPVLQLWFWSWAPCYSFGSEDGTSLGPVLQLWSRGSKITGPRATAMVLRLANDWAPCCSCGSECRKPLGPVLQLWF